MRIVIDLKDTTERRALAKAFMQLRSEQPVVYQALGLKLVKEVPADSRVMGLQELLTELESE